MKKSGCMDFIRIRHLTKVYPPSHQALNNVSLSVGPGVFGLLGPNGAGKTTLMRILATLLPATSGEVYFGDLPITAVKKVRARLGYLPQNIDFYPKLTALETLEYFALLSGLRSRHDKLRILLERVGLAEVAEKMVGDFSGGMKRRLGIAAAIVHDPDVIIVDEPTAGLDPEGRIEVRNSSASWAPISPCFFQLIF